VRVGGVEVGRLRPTAGSRIRAGAPEQGDAAG
jgi:hypothetical protein